MNIQEVYKKALAFTLKWEGGYVNNKNDLGGATNKGITQSVYNGYRKNKGLNPNPVKNITQQEVEDIYYNNYWIPSVNQLKKVGKDNDPLILIASFDLAVNMGVGKVAEYTKELGSNFTVKQFLDRRELSYIRFAYTDYEKKIPKYISGKNQSVFFKGWMNRLNSLRKYLETLNANESPKAQPKPVTKPTTEYIEYRVVRGDFLARIAAKYKNNYPNMKPEEIVKAITADNNIKNQNLIQIGQIIKIRKIKVEPPKPQAKPTEVKPEPIKIEPVKELEPIELKKEEIKEPEIMLTKPDTEPVPEEKETEGGKGINVDASNLLVNLAVFAIKFLLRKKGE